MKKQRNKSQQNKSEGQDIVHNSNIKLLKEQIQTDSADKPFCLKDNIRKLAISPKMDFSIKMPEYIYVEDIKQAIKLLKEEIKNASCDEETDYYDNCNFSTFEKIINKIFGSKLCS